MLSRPDVSILCAYPLDLGIFMLTLMRFGVLRNVGQGFGLGWGWNEAAPTALTYVSCPDLAAILQLKRSYKGVARMGADRTCSGGRTAC